MKLLTTQMRVDTFLDRWTKNYQKRDKGDFILECESRIAAIDFKAPDAVDQINQAVQNNSWTELGCDECGVDSGALVQLGAEPDYESATARICKDCLTNALALF